MMRYAAASLRPGIGDLHGREEFLLASKAAGSPLTDRRKRPSACGPYSKTPLSSVRVNSLSVVRIGDFNLDDGMAGRMSGIGIPTRIGVSIDDVGRI
jgi:hypothetical protein